MMENMKNGINFDQNFDKIKKECRKYNGKMVSLSEKNGVFLKCISNRYVKS